ncbi:hypothetical protein DUI87_27762 [Hirundo rustica rustica]|uniref:Uncharacterized protein n=1 Tax=Hirundo rustica rustica TaxID=333673 RepID=A0A3M0J5M7_HIRRU|nr:hypothetical protein DUI87_27762 [Hirundo rustica rustica]
MAASPGALRRAGNEEFRRGQYGPAAELYTRALAQLEAAGDATAEERSVLLANRAACHLKDGACSLCVADCTSALELVPFGIKPLLRRAAAYEALERYSLAYVDYKTALQVDCSVQAAHDGVNRVLYPFTPFLDETAAGMERAKMLKEEGNEFVKKGNHKKAVEKYSESLKLNKECATYTNRALCYLALKQYKEAAQDCTEALKLDPKNVKALYRRAQALKELKDYKSSIADIKSLLKTEPKNTAALRLLQELNRA